jgi:hypothetical protein
LEGIELHPKKLSSIAKLTSEDRCDYFIRKVADFEILWGLYGNSGWASSEIHGEIVMPVWPEEDFAILCATNSWDALTPKKIELSDFLDKWIPNKLNQYRYFGVFPVNGSDPIDVRSKLLKPDELGKMLLQELEQYK